MGPDGDETQLVQFRSLTRITAIQKTIAGGFSLFKRRVFRGAQSINIENLEGNPAVDENNSFSQSLSRSSQELLAAPIALQKHSIFTAKNDIVDDPASHLILVVHGIGEMLRSSDLFGISLPPMTSTVVDCCTSLRKNHADVLAANNNSSDYSSVGGFVEYLPVEWHEAFAMKSRWAPGDDGNYKDCVTLEDISLSTIPHMREFANDTMLDSKYHYQSSF